MAKDDDVIEGLIAAGVLIAIGYGLYRVLKSFESYSAGDEINEGEFSYQSSANDAAKGVFKDCYGREHKYVDGIVVDCYGRKHTYGNGTLMDCYGRRHTYSDGRAIDCYSRKSTYNKGKFRDCYGRTCHYNADDEGGAAAGLVHLVCDNDDDDD